MGLSMGVSVLYVGSKLLLKLVNFIFVRAHVFRCNYASLEEVMIVHPLFLND